MKIVNLTQHKATPEQESAGVFNHCHEQVLDLLVFEDIPTIQQIERTAYELAQIAKHSNASHAMIGGAPFLMSVLESMLLDEGIIPLYAFSKREVIESNEGNVVKKESVFRHLGFVKVV